MGVYLSSFLVLLGKSIGQNFRTVSLVLLSSANDELEIQNHCSTFLIPRDLNSGIDAHVNYVFFFLLTEFLSMFEYKIPEKSHACNN